MKNVSQNIFDVIKFQSIAMGLLFFLIVIGFKLTFSEENIGSFWYFTSFILPFFGVGIFLPVSISTLLFYRTFYQTSFFKIIFNFALKNYLVICTYFFIVYFILCLVEPDIVYTLLHPAASDTLQPSTMIHPWLNRQNIFRYIVVMGFELSAGIGLIVAILFSLTQGIVFGCIVILARFKIG